MLVVCEQSGGSSSILVKMLVACEPVLSSAQLLTKHCLVLSTIHMVEMLPVCEPSARNVALPGGSSDATSSTFQSQCGSLSSQIICISSGDVAISKSRFSEVFCSFFIGMNFIDIQLFFSSSKCIPSLIKNVI